MIQAVPRSSGGGGTEEEEEEMERGTVHISAHCDVVWARCEGLRSDLRVAYEKTAENKGEVVSYCVLCLSHHYCVLCLFHISSYYVSCIVLLCHVYCVL
jgi:hypothetical protein